VKNVTISLSEALLEKSRGYARSQGKSLNQLVRDALSRIVEDDFNTNIEAAFAEADRLALRLDSPMPSREERNAR
jgi:hypothetical protein